MPSNFASAYANRSVFVTGHTGFKGSWLVQWLDLLGARVVGYALAPPTIPNLFDVARVRAKLATHSEADVRDRQALVDAIRLARPEVVFHLAAQTVVRRSYRDPVETIGTNVVGTATLLEAIRESGHRCAVVIVTSDKAYENDESGRPLRETDALGGADPYSASKAAAEIVTSSFRRSFFPIEQLNHHGVAVATARAGNVIGGGDWTPDGLIADVARSLLAGRIAVIRNPSAVRPWQHVLEPLSGYLLLGSRLLGSDAAAYCRAWNFGPSTDDCVPVRDVVERLIAAWGGGRWEERTDPADPSEAHILRLSTARSRTELGWRPAWRLAEAVRRTAAWYRRYQADPGDAAAACRDDIVAFMASRRRPVRASKSAPD